MIPLTEEEIRAVLEALPKSAGVRDWMRRVLASYELNVLEAGVDLTEAASPERELVIRLDKAAVKALRDPDEGLVYALTTNVNRVRNHEGLRDMLIEELDISSRAYNCLKRAQMTSGRFRTVGEVADATDEDLLAIPNFGRFCLAEVREALASASVPTITDFAGALLLLWNIEGGECEHGFGFDGPCPHPDCPHNEVRPALVAATKVVE